MLPFLKNKFDVGMDGDDDEPIKFKNGDDELDLLGAVAEDILEAVEKKNSRHLKMALEALVEHIKAEDEEQDYEEESHKY